MVKIVIELPDDDVKTISAAYGSDAAMIGGAVDAWMAKVTTVQKHTVDLQRRAEDITASKDMSARSAKLKGSLDVVIGDSKVEMPVGNMSVIAPPGAVLLGTKV